MQTDLAALGLDSGSRSGARAFGWESNPLPTMCKAMLDTSSLETFNQYNIFSKRNK